ncbi:MAG: transcriptional regulator [Planctomycetaceae bacterium]|jgi:nitrogen regulatory protein PII|nr:transcriptional regulator [Planctomycetaceae bacterium]|tara:strand:+ start:129 stop:434 length:306 start_codon:yes stop_codon:yes gene_type:complete
MKQVLVIVKPFLAERVLEAISDLQVDALAVHEVKGYGRQKSYLDASTEQDRSLAFLPKVEIHCWVKDSQVDYFINSVSEVARTGRMGDGKIFILPVAQVTE